MAQLNFKSPGVSTREINVSGPTAANPIGIPAGVISTTQLGPAFVPITVPTFQDWITVFGMPVSKQKFGALSANEWLRTQQSLTHLRVLGAGDGTRRTLDGLNKGKVNAAGFVVGDRQPQSTLSGALGNNTYANTLTTSPNASGSAGRTYFLGCVMSQSANSTLLTDAGLSSQGVPIIRGVIFAASGVLVQLSSSNTLSSPPDKTQAADFSAGTVRGAFTGSLKISSGLQEFVMLLNGHKAASIQYPNVLTCSFDPNAPNYFGNVLNRDPLKTEEAGHLLYSHWDIFPALATPTGSGFITPVSGAAVAGNGYENIAFVITGSQSRNSGSIYAPNFENFEDRYRIAATPWITSQTFGGKVENLFKFWSVSDGETANTRVKISVENISPSNTTANLYGKFDVIVRSFDDVDSNKVILEQWRGLDLDPESDRFIGRIIGNFYTFFNWDAKESSQKLVSVGDFPVRSRYVRVELSDAVANGTIDPTAIPFGFRGPRHLVTSGSAPLPSFNSSYYTTTEIFNKAVEMPVPYRLNLARGTSPNQTADKKLYWGVQFEQVTSALEPNASSAPNKSMYAHTKYFPSFHTDFMNFVVQDNQGAADSAQNGIVDADRFNNNRFSLEKIRVNYNSTTLLPDLNLLSSWVYVRSGSIPTDSSAKTRALRAGDLLDPTVRNVAKFTVHMAGGFDGSRIFHENSIYMNDASVTEELNNASRGFSNGPTVVAYKRAIDIMKDNLEVDIQILATPGIRNRVVTDYAIAAIEGDRFDCFYIFDLEEKDLDNQTVTTAQQNVSITNTINNFRERGLDSSFAATYFPDVVMRDDINQTVEKVPPSIAVLGAIAFNDSVGHPWFAPAGFNRASLKTVRNAAIPLSRENLDDLYSERINPIVAFNGSTPVIWGQKTVKATVGSSLERINVRRMLLAARREVKKVSNQVVFEPNRSETLSKFKALVDPILKRIQDQGGVTNYKVDIDTSTTTEADVENKIIRGIVSVAPVKTLEFLSLEFTISNRGSFSGV